MLPDCGDVYLSFPWIKEVWLFSPAIARRSASDRIDLLVVSTIPPKQVPSGQRKRLLADLQACLPAAMARSDRPLDLRLTTGEQLSKWLSRNGGFAIAFRRHAVRLLPS